MQFDQGALCIQRHLQLLAAAGGALALQLRPLQIAGRTGAIGTLGGGFGTRQRWQHLIAQARDFQPRQLVAAMRFHQGGIQRHPARLAFDIQHIQLRLRRADARLRTRTAAQRQRQPGHQRGIATVLRPPQPQLPVQIDRLRATRQLQARLADPLRIGKLRQLRAALQQVGQGRGIGDRRQP